MGGRRLCPLTYPRRGSTHLSFSHQGRALLAPSTHPEPCEVIVDALHHGVGKGLMTSQGPVTPLPLPLLVKDKEYAVVTTRSIIQDVNLDECSKHEIDPLGDSGLFDIMRVYY
nr:hypothetical protein CFP56_62363 [Quercus suber]